ncbi:MAG: hypothetical protein ACOCWM_05260 [Cyclobacteriaceae bacterium]
MRNLCIILIFLIESCNIPKKTNLEILSSTSWETVSLIKDNINDTLSTILIKNDSLYLVNKIGNKTISNTNIGFIFQKSDSKIEVKYDEYFCNPKNYIFEVLLFLIEDNSQIQSYSYSFENLLDENVLLFNGIVFFPLNYKGLNFKTSDFPFVNVDGYTLGQKININNYSNVTMTMDNNLYYVEDNKTKLSIYHDHIIQINSEFNNLNEQNIFLDIIQNKYKIKIIKYSGKNDPLNLFSDYRNKLNDPYYFKIDSNGFTFSSKVIKDIVHYKFKDIMYASDRFQ